MASNFLKSVASSFAGGNPISLALGAGSNILGSIFQNNKSEKLMNQQIAAQREMQNIQHNFQREMWNASNEYNSPFAQMARFKAAGLNPNLIYGEMSPTTATPMAGGQSSQGSVPHVSNPMASLDPSVMSSIRLQDAQRQNINADTKVKEANAEKTSTEAKILSDFKLFSKDLFEGKVELQNGTINNLNIDAEVKSAQVENIMKSSRVLEATFDEINKRIENMGIQAQSMKLQNVLSALDALEKSSTFKYRVGIAANQYRVSEVQANYAALDIASKIALANATAFNQYQQGGTEFWRRNNLESLSGLNRSMQFNFDAQTNKINFHLDLDRKFAPWERTFGVANAGATAVYNFMTLPARIVDTNARAVWSIFNIGTPKGGLPTPPPL